MSTKLFVGNLSFNTTENEIHEAFSAHGTVVEANLMMDRLSGRSRGFAFVTFSTPEEAQKAIEALNGATLGDRALTVNIARPKEERPRGAVGGGDRGPRREYGGGGGGYGGGGSRGGGGGRDRY
jgi:cold-inducible RNA-binding protein